MDRQFGRHRKNCSMSKQFLNAQQPKINSIPVCFRVNFLYDLLSANILIRIPSLYTQSPENICSGKKGRQAPFHKIILVDGATCWIMDETFQYFSVLDIYFVFYLIIILVEKRDRWKRNNCSCRHRIISEGNISSEMGNKIISTSLKWNSY